jgi:hypothetical protein
VQDIDEEYDDFFEGLTQEMSGAASEFTAQQNSES